MSYNDLSDNGKNFEFGYDSENDTYGYYKDGVFTGFGGGGDLKVKFVAMVTPMGNYRGTYTWTYDSNFNIMAFDYTVYMYNAYPATIDNEYVLSGHNASDKHFFTVRQDCIRIKSGTGQTVVNVSAGTTETWDAGVTVTYMWLE